MNLYVGAAHSFTNPDADGSIPEIEYNERASDRAWQAMLGLLAEALGSPA
jgi:dienelactone hydrolase